MLSHRFLMRIHCKVVQSEKLRFFRAIVLYFFYIYTEQLNKLLVSTLHELPRVTSQARLSFAPYFSFN